MDNLCITPVVKISCYISVYVQYIIRGHPNQYREKEMGIAWRTMRSFQKRVKQLSGTSSVSTFKTVTTCNKNSRGTPSAKAWVLRLLHCWRRSCLRAEKFPLVKEFRMGRPHRYRWMWSNLKTHALVDGVPREFLLHVVTVLNVETLLVPLSCFYSFLEGPHCASCNTHFFLSTLVGMPTNDILYIHWYITWYLDNRRDTKIVHVRGGELEDQVGNRVLDWYTWVQREVGRK